MTDFVPGTCMPLENYIKILANTYQSYELKGLVSHCKALCEDFGEIRSIGHTVYKNGSLVISVRQGEVEVFIDGVKKLSSIDKLAEPGLAA